MGRLIPPCPAAVCWISAPVKLGDCAGVRPKIFDCGFFSEQSITKKRWVLCAAGSDDPVGLFRFLGSLKMRLPRISFLVRILPGDTQNAGLTDVLFAVRPTSRWQVLLRVRSCFTTEPAPAGRWEHEPRYEVLVRRPEVRAMIDGHVRLSRKRITGEQFLALCEKLVPTGVPLELLAGIIQPNTASWGILRARSGWTPSTRRWDG